MSHIVCYENPGCGGSARQADAAPALPAALAGWLAAHGHDGVPIDHRNDNGATALMYAASAGRHAVVRALLDLGADPGLRSQDDFTALDMAASIECLQLLRHTAVRPRT